MNIYKIDFLQYTNGLRDTIYSEKYDKYLSVNREGFVARESDLDYLKEFGKGFRELRFIGTLFNEPAQQSNVIVHVNCGDREIINPDQLCQLVSEAIKRAKN